MGSIPTVLAFLIDWGWLRIGPFIHINIDPVIFYIGPLALRWYGLMYVVAIMMGLWLIRGYTARKGISQDQVYRVLWWCVIGGLIGGRLYFVIQQPDFVSNYLDKPQNILATWEGGMAFFGAIFAVVPILFWRALRERVNPLVMLDAGALFAACGQIFGRIGNLINGDIIGYPSTLRWSTVYDNMNSWACQDPTAGTCHVPVQPAAGYELLLNVLLIAILLILARRYRRPGALMATYLFGYVITQFLVFFTRANIVVPLFNLNLGLKQAQWTSLIVFILLIPITILFMRSRWGQPVPAGEIPATYGIPQGDLPQIIAEPHADMNEVEVISPVEEINETETPVVTNEVEGISAVVALDETETPMEEIDEVETPTVMNEVEISSPLEESDEFEDAEATGKLQPLVNVEKTDKLQPLDKLEGDTDKHPSVRVESQGAGKNTAD